MILCLDVGNSQIYGGVFHGDEISLRFRKTTKDGSSSDETGIFLRTVLKENGIPPEKIEKVAICSVVPDLTHSLVNCCKKYFSGAPFILQAGVKSGLKIKYRNPLEVGADRIANAIAATHLFPQNNLVIVDFGTATTFCAVSADREYLGGVIQSGVKISMEALETKTAKLPKVEIVKPTSVIGRSTIESIQSGLYYGQLAMVKMIAEKMSKEGFSDKPSLLVGTGGFASLYESEKLFDHVVPDLVLKGLYLALKKNM